MTKYPRDPASGIPIPPEPQKRRTPKEQQSTRAFTELIRLHKIWMDQQAILGAEESLKKFLKLAWPAIEPGYEYVDGWHIDAICDHVQAVMDGEIRKLLINVPPRSTKSSIVSVALPAWRWIKVPEYRWLCCSYDLKLAKDDSRRCRDLIRSDWFQKNWGDKFQIDRNQDEKQFFANDHKGWRIAASTDTGSTGRGGDCIIYDDLNDVNQMNFDAYIDNVINFHERVTPSRLNDQKTGTRISVQQRSHERDITGHILSKEFGWVHLNIPMEYEGKRPATVLGWTDPRETEGELMCPARTGPTEVADLKVSLGPIAYNGQYQQRPSPGEGAKFKREWWRFYNPPGFKQTDEAGNTLPVRLSLPDGKILERMPVECPPAFEQVLQAWDMAFKEEKDSNNVCGQAWGRVGSNVFLLSRDCSRKDFPKTIAAVRKMSQEFPCPEKLVEDKANGPAVLQTLKNEIPGLIPSPIIGGLESLATASTGYVEAGNVYLPNPAVAPWVLDYIEQFAVFPRGKTDDDVAAQSHALRRLFDSVANSSVPEFRVVPRLNEPKSACHVEESSALLASLAPHWRRWVSLSPGAALWLCETPTRSIRVYRELDLDKIDAHETGRRIAQASIQDVTAFTRAIHETARWHCDIFMEKECFAAIEPIGCYAELVAEGIRTYEPDQGDLYQRQATKEALGRIAFSPELIEVEDAAWDRLRDLLRFAPADFQTLDYDRTEAMNLYRRDPEAWRSYMASCYGQVHGEWPKIKLSSDCKWTLAAMGAANRNDKAVVNPFMQALLIGITIPDSVAQPKLREIPWVGNGAKGRLPNRGGAHRTRQGIRRFGMVG